MKYIQTPKEVKLKELLEKKFLSPSMYNQIHCPNPNTIKVKDLIFPLQKGKEVGSSAYVEESKKKFIRTRTTFK